MLLCMQTAADKTWQKHRQRNDSHIVDTFQGQFHSKVTCPVCKKVRRPVLYFEAESFALKKMSFCVLHFFVGKCLSHMASKTAVHCFTVWFKMEEILLWLESYCV